MPDENWSEWDNLDEDYPNDPENCVHCPCAYDGYSCCYCGWTDPDFDPNETSDPEKY